MAKPREFVVLSIVLIATAMSACAPKNRGVLPLSSPSAPGHDLSGIDEDRTSAVVDRVRRRDNRSGAASSPTLSIGAGATDRADVSGRATGTSWSVVIESAPRTPVNKAEPTVKPALEDFPLEPAPMPSRPAWQRWLDLAGASIASVCCVLALRRRARSSVRSAQ